MVKKWSPIAVLLVLAWLFSSCGTPQDTEAIDSGVGATATSSPATIPPPEEPDLTDSQPDVAVIPVPISPESSISQVPNPEIASDAMTLAQQLTVRGRASDTSYSREAFGSAWRDVDRNGCDTRNDILGRDFSTTVFKPGTGNCKVIGGTWTDPYSNESYTFSEPPSRAQVDHVVSLKNAWQMGADLWTEGERVSFANDPLNLKVTVASLNQQKSDSNAASWLPPFKPGRCAFIATQVAVKAKWGLFVTESEKSAMIVVLSKPECQDTPVPN